MTSNKKGKILVRTFLIMILTFFVGNGLSMYYWNDMNDNLILPFIGFTVMFLGLVIGHADMESRILRKGIHFKISLVRIALGLGIALLAHKFFKVEAFNFKFFVFIFLYQFGLFFLTFDYLRNLYKNHKWNHQGTEALFDVLFAGKPYLYLSIKIVIYLLTLFLVWAQLI